MFRRRRGVRVRQRVRRIELWSVFKLALVFHAICGLISLAVLTLLWQLADRGGFIERITKFLVEIRFADDLTISGRTAFNGAATVAVGLVLHNTVVTVLLGALYNLLSGLFGGVIISVVEDDLTKGVGRAGSAGSRRTTVKPARNAQTKLPRRSRKSQRPVDASGVGAGSRGGETGDPTEASRHTPRLDRVELVDADGFEPDDDWLRALADDDPTDAVVRPPG